MYGLKEVDRLEVQKVRMPFVLYSIFIIFYSSFFIPFFDR